MGVCTFADASSARWAVQNLRDVDVDGRPIWVSMHDGGDGPGQQGEGFGSSGCRVFFSNVPYSVGADVLLPLFEEVGRVMEIRLFKNKNGSSRGMGHCIYQSASMATAAIKVLRDRNVEGRPIWVADDMQQGTAEAMNLGHSSVYGPSRVSSQQPMTRRFEPY